MIVLDMDATDDPTRGQQQLSFFHGYYEEYMYHPLLVFDGRDGFPLAAVLLPGNTHASRGALAGLKRLIKKLKQAYPKVCAAAVLLFTNLGMGQTIDQRLAAVGQKHYLEAEGIIAYHSRGADELVCGEVIPVEVYATTLRRRLIDVAAKIVRHAGKIILKVAAAAMEQLEFTALWARSSTPPRLAWA